MAKVCKCHQNRNAAVAAGMDFHEAYRKYSKPGYHEHRCECACKCKSDTLGYAYCPTCHFNKDCLALRNQSIGILGLPFRNVE